jgi:hypothetical protein
LEAIRRDVQPRVVAELDRLEEQIAAVLDQGQREQWHQVFEQLRKTWIPLLPKTSPSPSGRGPG